MIRIIQAIAKFIAMIVGYNLHIQKQGLFSFVDDVDQSYPAINTNNKTLATINAAFANRFVLIPFHLMASILLNKKSEELTIEDKIHISSKNKLAAKINSPKSYINEYEDWREMFYKNYSLRKKNQEWENDSSTEIITEEINHNNYINKTTTYSILQSLTIYYRFCNAYLAYYDSKQTDKKHEGYKVILEGLVNSILIRSYISKYNYPIIESFQHYKQFSFKEIKDIYNFVTAKNADFFKKVESLIHEKVLDYNDEDIFLVAQTALNFPFIYQLKKSNLKFEKFWRLYSQYPEKVLRNILQFLSYSEKLDRAAFLKELDKISSTSKADYSVTGCLISFGTSKIIHKGLISFIIKQSLFTKYNKVISYYIKAIYQRKGGTINQAYDGSPAFKAWGIDDQEFNIDPAMGLFDSEAFTIAVLSFEPSLVGEKKNLNILNSNKCETILLRTIYLHCLTHCIINSLNYKDFLKNFDYIFNVRPILIPYKNCINNFLELVFSMSIGNLEKSSFNKYSRQINDKIIEYLITDIDKLRNKMYEEYSDIQRKMIFRVCDTLYAHGF